MAEFGEQIIWEDGHAKVVNTSAVLSYLQPFEELRACTEQGHINAMNDTDGVMRHGVLYVEPDEAAEAAEPRIYSMSYLAAQSFMRRLCRTLTLRRSTRASRCTAWRSRPI